MIKIQTIKGKKAQGKIVTAGPLMTATIVVAILLIIFFVFTKAVAIQPKVKGIDALTAKEQILDSLISYLSTPVYADNQEIKISDLIRLAKLNPSYKDALKSKTEEIFDKTYGEHYSIEVKNIFSIDKGAAVKQVYQETITIPDNIEIIFYLKK
jgi:hypothetical protein